METWPVTFVNRYDVAEYLKWCSRQEGRLHRLPTAMEFEWAARAGAPNAKYPWGDAGPDGKANYDPSGTRTFAEWRRYLKPVKSYRPTHGASDGRKCQQMVDCIDPATSRFVYRILRRWNAKAH
jgi:formylglycine-generating enzyme required for sulfatase activity